MIYKIKLVKYLIFQSLDQLNQEEAENELENYLNDIRDDADIIINNHGDDIFISNKTTSTITTNNTTEIDNNNNNQLIKSQLTKPDITSFPSVSNLPGFKKNIETKQHEM